MKRLAVFAMALGMFSLPAAAQQADNSKVTQEVQAITTQYIDTFNHKDAAALAALYTKDGVFVNGAGQTISGQAAVEKFYEAFFKTADFILDGGADEIHGLGDGAWAIGHTTVTIKGQGEPKPVLGHYAAVYSREGAVLKVRLVSAAANTPPPPPPAK
jgi:uncharacterized protein (TIGR02246 family)